MQSHKNKMIAPIIICIIFVLYFIVYFGILYIHLSGILRIILGILPLGFALLTVWVCIERIKEIRKGEEDDIGKY